MAEKDRPVRSKPRVMEGEEPLFHKDLGGFGGGKAHNLDSEVRILFPLPNEATNLESLWLLSADAL